MRRLIASRKLYTNCRWCDDNIIKGQVYYRHRVVDKYDDEVVAYSYNECAKCRYRIDDRLKRRVGLKERCHHPIEMQRTEYDYIPGECVMEPQYDICLVCNLKY